MTIQDYLTFNYIFLILYVFVYRINQVTLHQHTNY